MHKIFAKTLFLGKKIIFLPECHSTNLELSGLAKESSIIEGTVLCTDHQIAGRGQRGNRWDSEQGKNLLFSILLRPQKLNPKKSYLLNVILGLALYDALQPLLSGELKIKWPNDIYLNNQKLAGILIESNMRGTQLASSVCGVGLNVNQIQFNNAKATSLALAEKQDFDRDFILEEIIRQLEKWYLKLLNGRSEKQILAAYHEHLYWKGQERNFRTGKSETLGTITGIDINGMLQVQIGGQLESFGIKEIEFLS